MMLTVLGLLVCIFPLCFSYFFLGEGRGWLSQITIVWSRAFLSHLFLIGMSILLVGMETDNIALYDKSLILVSGLLILGCFILYKYPLHQKIYAPLFFISFQVYIIVCLHLKKEIHFYMIMYIYVLSYQYTI